MRTLVVWGEDDHRNRATSLGRAYGTTAVSINATPTDLTGLGKMVFWGHGTRDHFCRKTPEEFVALVKAWKKANPSLRTVEMLTCNARHAQQQTDSYTDRVVDQLSRRKYSTADKVNFRALPKAMSPAGTACAYSILKWHPGSETWAYVAAPINNVLNRWDSYMFDAARALEDFIAPAGTATDYPRAHALFKAHVGPITLQSTRAVTKGWDQARVDHFNTYQARARQDAYIQTGTLGTLRWMLTDIK